MRHATQTCAAFSLIETVISVGLVGSLMVAAMNVVGASEMSRQKGVNRSTGLMLAEDLMSEVLAMPYRDPEDGTSHFGNEPTDPSTSVRSLFDDVDDFHGWAASPPKEPDGTVRPGFANWERRVLVQRVHANNPAMPMGSETGVKWVIVIVERDGVEVCRLHAHRADIDPG